LLYSNDGITWTTQGAQVAVQWVLGVSKTFSITPITAKYFRLSVGLVGNTGTSSRTNFVVNELALTQNTSTNSVMVPTLISNKTTFTNDNELVSKKYVNTTPSIISGYPFNPIQNGTTAITSGNKYYWFTCSLNMAAIISGYSIYVAAGGADNVRVGIYRGYLKSGAVGVGANITLVGQSIPSLLTLGLPFNKNAITVVAGQSLSFAAGEYMTIAFHSNGTSNSYVASPVASALSVDISFNTTTNYVVAGFPNTITNTAINGANLNRPCFELY
jgi:hypothetical protein